MDYILAFLALAIITLVPALIIGFIKGNLEARKYSKPSPTPHSSTHEPPRPETCKRVCLPDPSSSPSIVSQHDVSILNSLIEMEYMRKQLLIENLNEEYALGLYEGDIYAIARADDPPAALEKFAPKRLPSLEEYRENFGHLLHVITHGVDLPQEEADKAEIAMREINEECGEEVIALFADACSNLMYGDLAFLNGKINYLLCVTTMFCTYSEITGDTFWENKADEILEKRGYGQH